MGIDERRAAVALQAAETVATHPVSPTGMWYTDDIRRNFYLATHLFVAARAQDAGRAPVGTIAGIDAGALATTMLKRVLRLQRREPTDPMYGHWPKSVSVDDPMGVAEHEPGELLIIVLALFRKQHQDVLSASLLAEIDEALLHQYRSGFALSPLYSMHHHDATHVAQRLILGHHFSDSKLLTMGQLGLSSLLSHLRTFGFKEYGALPWFWHWIQAFSAAWECLGEENDGQLEEILEALWRLRVDNYLGGAWTGPRSRQWPHDIPSDGNTAMDFIQFGDFPLPRTLQRVEGDALYSYRVPKHIYDRAIERPKVTELKKRVHLANADGRIQGAVHLYGYTTRTHAVGGVWERKRHFDNEQHRWDVALPIGAVDVDQNINHAYLFHPGAMYTAGDLRHQSTYGDVLYWQDTVIEIWNVLEEDSQASPTIVGCLPRGDWLFEDRHGYGSVGQVYMSLHVMEPFTTEVEADRLLVTAPLVNRRQGVILETMSVGDAKLAGIDSVEQFRSFCREANENMYRSMITKSKPYFSDGRGAAAGGANAVGDDVEKIVASYVTHRGAHLLLEVDRLGRAERFVDGSVLSYNDYPVRL